MTAPPEAVPNPSAEAPSTPTRGRVWDWPPTDPYRPLPKVDRITRFFIRVGIRKALRQVIEVRGLEFIEETNDPFLVVANHSQRFEAVMLPAILMWHRHGRRIYYMADWPMMLIPGVGLMYRAGKIIPVFNKSAKPAFLNVLKPWFQRGHEGTAWERASAILQAGHPVGVFPEGTMNRHPRVMLRGRAGAAMLALENGVPVVPVGIRFPENSPDQPIRDGDRMTLEIGPPLTADPDSRGETVSKRAAVAFHEKIMRELERLSGKEWNPRGPRRRIQHVA